MARIVQVLLCGHCGNEVAVLAFYKVIHHGLRMSTDQSENID